MMTVFARWGFDVWTMDHEGYGRSSRTEGNADVASGVEDLKAASEVVARESGRSRLDVLAFYQRLANPDRQMVVLAGAAHSLGLGLHRHQLWHVVRAFLELPPIEAAGEGKPPRG